MKHCAESAFRTQLFRGTFSWRRIRILPVLSFEGLAAGPYLMHFFELVKTVHTFVTRSKYILVKVIGSSSAFLGALPAVRAVGDRARSGEQ
jgi:hypothetical protein